VVVDVWSDFKGGPGNGGNNTSDEGATLAY